MTKVEPLCRATAALIRLKGWVSAKSICPLRTNGYLSDLQPKHVEGTGQVGAQLHSDSTTPFVHETDDDDDLI